MLLATIVHAKQAPPQNPQPSLEDDLRQMIADFRRIQPKLERLADREEELTTLLDELGKLATVEFEENDTLGDPIFLDGVANDGVVTDSVGTALPAATAQEDQNPTQQIGDNPISGGLPEAQPASDLQNLSAAERFRMMQTAGSGSSNAPVAVPSETEAPIPDKTVASTQDTEELNTAGLSAAERFRMMQQSVPTITRASEQTADVSSPSNATAPVEQAEIAADRNPVPPASPVEPERQLSAAERFRMMQADAYVPAPGSSADENDRTVTANNANNLAPINPRLESPNSPGGRQDNTIVNLDNVSANNDIRTDGYNPDIPASKRNLRPLEDRILPQQPGEHPVLANQIRGKMGAKPPSRRPPSHRVNLQQRPQTAGSYYLHLFSYKSLNEQQITQNWLKTRKNLPNNIASLKFMISPQITNESQYNRMYLGPLNSRAEALHYCKQLQKLNYYCKTTNNP